MQTGADVRSLEAIRDWHGHLGQFRSEAHNALTTLNLSLQRIDDWLQDQVKYWNRQIRLTYDECVQAKTDLRNRQNQETDIYKPDLSEAEERLEKAIRRLEFCEERAETTRRWLVKLPQLLGDVFRGPSQELVHFLDGDLPRAMVELSHQITALERYLGIEPVSRKEGP